MSKKIDREAEIQHLSEESLRERLLRAEELCVIFGWSASHSNESPRERLAYEAWNRWIEYVGLERGGGVRENQRIDSLPGMN